MSDDQVRDGEDGKPAGPFAVLLSPDIGVWNEARKLSADINVRVENLATVAVQDPVIIMELLKVSNALYFSGGRSPITSPKTAIVRLGSDVVLQTLEELKDRERPGTDLENKWIDIHRSRCRRTGIIARIMGEALARNLSDDCQAAGCLSSVGEMLAVTYLKEKYTELAEEHNRTAANYRLTKNFDFDVEKMGINYLRRYGIPEALLFAIDPDSRTRAQDRAIMKPLCMAAIEMVDAFDSNKWEKLAPGKNLPPKSHIRMLGVGDSQYLKIYERASEYLFSARMLDERRKQESIQDFAAPAKESDPSADLLESEIKSILKGEGQEPDTSDQTQIEQLDYSLVDPDDQFKFTNLKSKENSAARKQATVDKVAPPQLRTSSGNKFLGEISNMFEGAQSSEDLLASLLQMLIDGPYEKSALIVVSKDKKHAIVVAARGPNIGNGQRIELKDPLSPLAQCFSKVQSFASKANEASPFGCKSFALAPIDADHDTPVALYADCGHDGALTFEARRIFRTVVNILNEKLPTIPGGIPVELL